MKPFALLIAASALLAACATTAQTAGVYVRADGLVNSDGLSPSRAVSSLTRARDIARTLPPPRTIHIIGPIALDAPLELGPKDSGTAWIGEPGAALLGKGKLPFAIQAWRVHDAAFRGFAISDFTRFGINLLGPTRVTISGLAVSRITSNGWSQGGIFASGNVMDLAITDNVVSDTDYTGIAVFSNYQHQGLRITIARNRVERTCKSVADCGAIYLGGRGVNAGSRIADNIVNDFGPHSTMGRGIYLDDWESNVVVTGNCISGPGVFGMHIHGGNNNKIIGNRIDARGLRAALLNQAVSRQPMRDMVGNVFADNTIYIDPALPNILEERQSQAAQVVKLSGNRVIEGPAPSQCPF